MSFNELCLLLYEVFESRLIIKQFKTKDLEHYKKCIDLELKKRGKIKFL